MVGLEAERQVAVADMARLAGRRPSRTPANRTPRRWRCRSCGSCSSRAGSGGPAGVGRPASTCAASITVKSVIAASISAAVGAAMVWLNIQRWPNGSTTVDIREPWGWSAGSRSATAPCCDGRGVDGVDVGDLEVQGAGRTLVAVGGHHADLRVGVGQHDPGAVDDHLGVADPAVVADVADRLDAVERGGVPVEGGGGVGHGEVGHEDLGRGAGVLVRTWRCWTWRCRSWWWSSRCGSSIVGASAASICVRRRAAKRGSGSRGRRGRHVGGAVRRRFTTVTSSCWLARSGCGSRPGPHEQRLGGVRGAAEFGGDLGDREVVDVAQRQRGAMVGAEFAEHVAGRHHVELGVPRIVGPSSSSPATALRRRSSRSTRRQWSTSLWRAMPISQATVTSPDDRAMDRVDRGQEHLGREILGGAAVAAPPMQVAVHLGECIVVERRATPCPVTDLAGHAPHNPSMPSSSFQTAVLRHPALR